MDRRKFLTSTSCAGLALTAIGAGATGATAETKKRTGRTGMAPAPDTFALNELTIGALQENMRSGRMTSRSITALYLKRIAAIDANGIRLNAVIEVNPDALAIADAMDRERKAGTVRGPLHGIPVLVKDNIDTAVLVHINPVRIIVQTVQIIRRTIPNTGIRRKFS